MTVVIDASVAIARLLRQDGYQDVDTRLRTWRRDGVDIVVPAHFWLEVTNALLRRRGLPGSAVVEAVHRLDQLVTRTVDLDRPFILLALDLAERFGLTAYDAAYLAVAETVDGVLFTADRDLFVAAGARGQRVEGATNHRLSEDPAPYRTEGRPTWPDYARISAYLAELRADTEKRLAGPTMTG